MSDDDTDVLTHILPIAGLNVPSARQAMRETTGPDLLKMVGDRACGPVSWRYWYGKVACTVALRAIYADDPRPSKTFALDQYEAFFEEHPHDCVLIVASVDFRP